ncbi:MAG: dUTPase [Bacilli bacterium]|nr:dUTPase [Bacilli bacterium]
MNQFSKVYEENKILDEIFHNLYDNFSKDTIEKNIVELLVEIGELANETRCFKYWSNKGSSEKDIVLDEYADCFLMTL